MTLRRIAQGNPVKPPRAFDVVFWLAVIALPAIACLATILQFPPGADNVPMHWNAAGSIDGYGSPWEMLPFGIIMGATNALLAACYAFNDFLYDHGLVHNISRKGALVLYRVLAVFIAIVTVGILVFWTIQAMAAMA